LRRTPNARAIWAADIQKHAAVIHQRRTDGSEEAFRRIELLPRIHAPEALAGGEIESLQNALRSERENSLACHGRRRAGSLIEAKIIAIIGRVRGRPDALSGVLVQRLHDRLLVAPMEQNHPSARHHRGAKTLAHVHLPQHFDPWFRPRCRQLAA
jgi:hypothetical protein